MNNNTIHQMLNISATVTEELKPVQRLKYLKKKIQNVWEHVQLNKLSHFFKGLVIKVLFKSKSYKLSLWPHILNLKNI